MNEQQSTKRYMGYFMPDSPADFLAVAFWRWECIRPCIERSNAGERVDVTTGPGKFKRGSNEHNFRNGTMYLQSQ